MASWYVNSVGWTAVTAWAALTAYTVGDLRRQLAAPAVGSERVFRCTTAGTSGAAEPTWTLTVGATTNDATAVWTEVTGNATYNWLAPHARLANSFASGWGVAGDTFYVGDNHAETQAAAMAITCPGTVAAPSYVLCVSVAGTVPPVSADLRTTATISTTGAFALTLSNAGFASYYGITFNCGSGATNAVLTWDGTAAFNSVSYFKNCALRKLGTTAIATAIRGSTNVNFGRIVVLDNTTVQFGAVGDGIAPVSGSVQWKNTPNAITGAVFPTNLFCQATSSSANVQLEGVDLSALGSGKTIVAAISTSLMFFLKDCKLGDSVAVSASQILAGATETYLTNCDSSGTNYRHEKYAFTGSQVVETTIVRTGGASIKGTPIAWKLVTSAGSRWLVNFLALPIAIPDNGTIGSPITITVQGIWGGGAVPLNDEIWMEVEYLGDAASPQGSFATSGKADILATGANLTAGSGTWGGSTTKFQMSVTITPQLKGPIYVYVKAAKASSTFYIDPLPIVT